MHLGKEDTIRIATISLFLVLLLHKCRKEIQVLIIVIKVLLHGRGKIRTGSQCKRANFIRDTWHRITKKKISKNSNYLRKVSIHKLGKNKVIGRVDRIYSAKFQQLISARSRRSTKHKAWQVLSAVHMPIKVFLSCKIQVMSLLLMFICQRFAM